MPRRQQIHAALAAGVMLALLAGGWTLAGTISSSPLAAATTTLPGQTTIVNHTRVLTRVVKGRVVRLKGGQRVVRVPVVVIHNLKCHPTRHHHCVRRIVVPAHTIPLRAATPILAAVAIAAPLMPVTVYATVTSPPETVTLPGQTVTLPQATTTETTVSVSTVTETVTLPLAP